MQKLKVALVGCGGVAKLHLEGIKQITKNIEITAVVDCIEARAKHMSVQTGAPYYLSLSDALKNNAFDAVDIMLPHDLHETATLQALQAKKHVLLEKPISTSLVSCERMLTAAKKANVVFMIAENAQYWPEIIKAKQLIEEGVIGEIITAQANFVFPFKKEDWYNDPYQWRSQASRMGGGIVIDGGSHWIRALRMWMGEVTSAVSVTGSPLTLMEGESQCHAILKFESGKVATFNAMVFTSHIGSRPWWQITGTKGEITIDPGMHGKMWLHNESYPNGHQIMEPQGYYASFGFELEDFAHAVLTRSSPKAGPESSLADLKTILAIYQSAKTRRWEKTNPTSNYSFTTIKPSKEKTSGEKNQSVAIRRRARL